MQLIIAEILYLSNTLCSRLLQGVCTEDTANVGDPDPHVFGYPGSGSISQRCGSGSGAGFFKSIFLVSLKSM
jgi:hypothetical protein